MTPAQPEPVHFLLVDDLEENLLALDALLRRAGLVLLKARSGPEALELLLRHEVALALLDVQMPGMDGFELAELMRGTERTRRVPIIFVTAGTTDHQRRFRGYEAGAVDFLTKPIEPEVLRSKAGVFFDLYRQRQEVARLLNESRQLTEALREADRRKDEFLATLAHELRNPLAPIRTGLQILKMSPAGPAADRSREMMDRQLGHMVRLIEDLLDISRLSQGKLELRRERVELRTVVESGVEISRPLIDAGRHELAVFLPDEPVWLDADPTRVAQVIGNVLTNAAKYTLDGGRIELAARREKGDAVVSVADNGVGIPREMQDKVFDMFSQVNRTIDRSQGGLGIGLALVKRLTEMHGGTITVESAGAGLGSTFTIRIPVAASSEGDPASRENGRMPADLVRRRILVVDDNEDGAESLAMMLELSGHETRTAHDGQQALDTARTFAPDIVFLDIGLPGMSGYEVARRFRAEPGLREAVLVALTGRGSEDDKQQSNEAGFNFHLTKPTEVAAVEGLLARVRAEDNR